MYGDEVTPVVKRPSAFFTRFLAIRAYKLQSLHRQFLDCSKRLRVKEKLFFLQEVLQLEDSSSRYIGAVTVPQLIHPWQRRCVAD